MSVKHQPNTLWEQFKGKAQAELSRGCGHWPRQSYPVDLEPPYDEYDYRSLSAWDCYVNQWQGPFKAGFLGKPVRSKVVHKLGEPLVLPPADWAADIDLLVPITIDAFPEDEATIEKAEQFLRSLPMLERPASFEVIGMGADGDRDPYISTQFVVDENDAKRLVSQLVAQYSSSAIVAHNEWQATHNPNHSAAISYGYMTPLGLTCPHCFSLKTFSRIDPDPLGVVIAAMEDLADGDWAMLQVLFSPARYDWAAIAEQAIVDPYKGQPFFNDLDGQVVAAKFGTPLFAVAIRLAAGSRHVWEQLMGWAGQFTLPPQDLADIESEEDDFVAMLNRTSYRPGLLLNSQELASVVHLPGPGVVSERLGRVKVRTKAAPIHAAEAGAVYLGENLHRGVEQEVWVPPATRTRHCYIAGASGTGKTTLLKNMIWQDIKAGHGVGVIEPHGDLIDDILNLIPRERVPDVVYFNPADDEWPPAFNLLECKDKSEKERIVFETVQTIHKFFADSWGPQLEQYLTYALVTLLKFPGSTLEDLQSILTDDTFRKRHVAKLDDPMLLTFWNKEFAKHGRNAVRPILNKLVPFLLYPTVANVVKQRQSAFDFDQIINERKILLVRLPVGALSEQMISIFGTFIMSKLVSAAFRREKIPEASRVPFHLYIDEFQNFVSLAVSFDRLLSEARKYKLLLHVANQYVDQLPRAIRSAVFGNVKTMVVFRVSPMDSKLLGSEFAGFKPDEITSLDTGEAIARVGGSQDSFNLKCQPPPAPLSPSCRGSIIKQCRHKYAKRSKQPVGVDLVCERYVDNVVRFVWGDTDVNEKLMAAVEQELGVQDVGRWRKQVEKKATKLDEGGEYFTVETVPQMAQAFEAVWQRIQQQEKAKEAEREKKSAAKAKPPPAPASSQFVVTATWRAVPEGAQLPDGVETKVDQEGVTYARLSPDHPAVGKIVPETTGKSKQQVKPVKKAAGSEETKPVPSPEQAATKPRRKKKQAKVSDEMDTPVQPPPEVPSPDPPPKADVPERIESEDAGGAADPDDDFI